MKNKSPVEFRQLKEMPFRVGLANDPKQYDPSFENYEKALAYAHDLFATDLQVFAIWNGNDDVVALVHLDSVWKK